MGAKNYLPNLENARLQSNFARPTTMKSRPGSKPMSKRSVGKSRPTRLTLLHMSIGANLRELNGEIEKLFIATPSDPISREDVAQVIDNTRGVTVFELAGRTREPSTKQSTDPHWTTPRTGRTPRWHNRATRASLWNSAARAMDRRPARAQKCNGFTPQSARLFCQ